jgi:hypothetical protein
MLFELCDSLANRAVCQEEFLGGLGKAAMPRDGFKRSERVESWQFTE